MSDMSGAAKSPCVCGALHTHGLFADESGRKQRFLGLPWYTSLRYSKGYHGYVWQDSVHGDLLYLFCSSPLCLSLWLRCVAFHDCKGICSAPAAKNGRCQLKKSPPVGSYSSRWF